MAGSPPTIPASLDASVAWAARMAARRAHASWRPSHASRRFGIELRRFAGPGHLPRSDRASAHRAPDRPARRTHHAGRGAADGGRDDQRREARPGAADRRLRLPQPALPGSADAGDARLRGARDRRARQPRSLVGRRGGQARAGARRRRGAAQPAHDDHAAPRAPADRRAGRRVHRTRAPRRSGEGAASRPAEHRPVAHRRGGGRPVAARRAAGAVRAHARRPGHARAPARVRRRPDRRTQVRARPLRIAPPRGTSARITNRRARSTSAPASAPRWCRSASAIAASAR